MEACSGAEIAVVVVTYNRCGLLRENIEALRQQRFSGKYDVVIVDNASTDGTELMVSSLIETQGDMALMGLHYQNTGANLGGAGGFQFGVRWAAEHGYEYIWLMDDDCIPEPTALARLWEAHLDLKGKYGWLSSQVRWKDGSICAMNVQRRTLVSNVKDWQAPLVSCAMASFVSLFLPASVVRQVGLPIKEFFIWTDDWEYTRRISRCYPCYLVNQSLVVHKSAANLPANLANDSLERLPRYKFLYRNDVYLYRREGLMGLCYEVLRLGLHVFRVLFMGRDKKLERIRMLLVGTWSGLSFHPAIEFLVSGDEQDEQA